MSKDYGLDKRPNEGVKDQPKEWMNDFFKKMTEPKPEKKAHPFAGIKDPILNPNNIGLDK